MTRPGALRAQPHAAPRVREANVKHRAVPAVFPNYFTCKKALVVMRRRWRIAEETGSISVTAPDLTFTLCNSNLFITDTTILKYCHKYPEAVYEELIEKQGYI